MADVIVIGAGATGITAAIAARELGASVIVLEAERHIGGHAICSGGNLSFGGDAGQDADFDKPRPRYRMERPPFYAAWATPVIHDSRAGLRINSRCEVLDTRGEVIRGLYCGGESAGGLSVHGLPRAICQGLIAGREFGAIL